MVLKLLQNLIIIQEVSSLNICHLLQLIMKSLLSVGELKMELNFGLEEIPGVLIGVNGVSSK